MVALKGLKMFVCIGSKTVDRVGGRLSQIENARLPKELSQLWGKTFLRENICMKN